MFLYVIRHGDSVYNLAGRAEGHSDSGLTLTGINYIMDLVPILRQEFDPPQIIFSSDLARAYNTAVLLGEQLGIDSDRIYLTKFLREVYYGDYAGRKFDDFDPSYHRDMDKFFPNGESRNFMKMRVLYYINQFILKQPATSIILIVHGGPLRAILSQYAGMDFFTLYEKPTPRCIYKFEFKDATSVAFDCLYSNYK